MCHILLIFMLLYRIYLFRRNMRKGGFSMMSNSHKSLTSNRISVTCSVSRFFVLSLFD